MRRMIWSMLLMMVAAGLAAGAQDISTVEQKAEALRGQLRGVMDKQAELQTRLAQLDEDLKSENIQRSVSTIGTTDANALRDQRQAQLEREKAHVEEQLRSLENSRTRLEASIASADAEGVRLRANALGASNAPQPVTTTNPANAAAAPSPVLKTQSARTTKSRRYRRARRRAH